jgi:uncharacterized protein YjbI with pentapeptide repeats
VLRRTHRDLGGGGGSVAEGFRCDVDSEYRSACKDLPKYLGSRFLGSRFCVLHYPGEDKDKEEFLNVKKSKLDRKDYDFSGTVFPEGTSDFEGREFDADASFRGATFVGSAIFYRAQFSGERTDFSRAQFSGEIAIFIAAQFSSAQTYFSEANFSAKRTEFGAAQFSGALTYLSEAQFSGEETDFTIAKFSSGRTKFRRAEFSSGRTKFSGATFNGQNGQPDFQDTTFRNATFENTTFQDGADFTGAKFNGTRAISNGIRERTTDFRRAIFGRELYFRGAEFKGFTDFYRTSFLDAARFIGGEREEGTSSLFAAEGQVSFKRARIDKPELFSFDTLLMRPSWFVGVDARKFDFTAVQWYGLSNGSAGTFDKAFDKEIKGIREKGETGSPYILLAQACRRLSANAEENHEYPLANEFHYWSMDAVRREGWSHLRA